MVKKGMDSGMREGLSVASVALIAMQAHSVVRL
jgi:hypothetical protein